MNWRFGRNAKVIVPRRGSDIGAQAWLTETVRALAASMQIYDSIGTGYKELRREDPRIAAALRSALGAATSVVNVGAGAGSYEPRDRAVVAVEPSATMIGQRAFDAFPVVRGNADRLPFADDSFDASLAILTIHHWKNLYRSLAELRRVAREEVVILTWDPAAPGFWLTDYFPDILRIDQRIFPTMDVLSKVLGETTVVKVLIPSDCSDGFLGAYWSRPEAYLLPDVRQAISTFAKLDDVKPGLIRLREDLDSGAWEARNGELRNLANLDLGYRFVVVNLGD
ncbi:MAG: SAM-dependent methyltransferase [Planctomycetota bacterium]|jgi:SAM-dependent methyltransferase